MQRLSSIFTIGLLATFLIGSYVQKGISFKSYGLTTDAENIHYIAGYYMYANASVALNQGSPSTTFGGAGNSYAAHPYIVSAGDGAVDAGTVSLRATCTSITDGGTRTPADSEIILADITSADANINIYQEAAFKCLGTVTLELIPDGATTYNLTVNLGYAKHDDMNNENITIVAVECLGHTQASDDNLEIELLKHGGDGDVWIYHATAFVPGGTILASLSGAHATDDQFDSGEYFAFKRDNLNTAIEGNNGEGVILRVTVITNNAIENGTCHIGYTS